MADGELRLAASRSSADESIRTFANPFATANTDAGARADPLPPNVTVVPSPSSMAEEHREASAANG